MLSLFPRPILLVSQASFPSSIRIVSGLCSAEAAKSLEGEPPWTAAHAVSVGDDVGAKMPTANVFAVEERHVCVVERVDAVCSVARVLSLSRSDDSVGSLMCENAL